MQLSEKKIFKANEVALRNANTTQCYPLSSELQRHCAWSLRLESGGGARENLTPTKKILKKSYIAWFKVVIIFEVHYLMRESKLNH